MNKSAVDILLSFSATMLWSEYGVGFVSKLV